MRILSPPAVLSQGGFADTPSGGTSGVQVCYQRDAIDPFAGTNVTQTRSVSGSGVISTSHGRASFSVQGSSLGSMTGFKTTGTVVRGGFAIH